MPYLKHSQAEVAARGEALYEQLRERLESSHLGQFLVIDIESGEFEIAPDDLVATKQLLARVPQAISYGVRIGSQAAYRLG